MWTAAAKWTTQLLSWGSTLIVARILAPDDYGLVVMATVFVGAVTLLNDLGLSASIIQSPELSREKVGRLAGLLVIVSLALTSIAAVASPAVALGFGEPRLAAVAAALSVLILLSGLQATPRGLLTRQLRFRMLALSDAVQSATTVVVTLILALVGKGYWSLVIGTLSGHAAAAGLLTFAAPYPIRWPVRVSELASELRFGVHLLAANLGWYFYSNTDAVVVGRFLGSALLGSYSIATTIASAPIVQITGMVSRVTAGTFASAQGNPALLRKHLLVLVEISAFFLIPATVGVVLVAPELVNVLMGDQWTASIAPLQVLASAAAIRALLPIPIQALVYSGHPERNTRITTLSVLLYPVLFAVGSAFGLVGVATAWLVGVCVLNVPLTVTYLKRDLGLATADVVAALAAPLMCAAGMVSVVATLSVSAPLEQPLHRLALLTGSGAVTYLVLVRGFCWARVRNLALHLWPRDRT